MTKVFSGVARLVDLNVIKGGKFGPSPRERIRSGKFHTRVTVGGSGGQNTAAVPPPQKLLSQKEFEVVEFTMTRQSGVSPSKGSTIILGPPGIATALKTRPFIEFDLLEEDLELNSTVKRKIRKLKVVRYEEVMPRLSKKVPAGMLAYKVEFEDFRWILNFGGVFGEFNIIQDFAFDGKPIFKRHSLKKDGTPWLYGELISLVLKSLLVSFEGGRENVDCKVIFLTKGKSETRTRAVVAEPQLGSHLTGDVIDVAFESKETALGNFPWNKKWWGTSRRAVLNELLREIGYELSIDDAGDIFIVPQPKQVDVRVSGIEDEKSPRVGLFKGAVPEKVFVIGAKSVRMELVEAMLPQSKSYQQTVSDFIEEIGASTSLATANDAIAKFIARKFNELAGTVDYPIWPAIPDLSGRWRILWDILDQWDIDIGGFCLWMGSQESIKTLQDNIPHDPPNAALPEVLYPEEVEFVETLLKLGLPVDCKQTKASLLHANAFKAWWLKGPIRVEYNWDAEQKKIISDFAGDVPSGTTELDSEQFLPLRDFLSPIWVFSSKEKEEGKDGLINLFGDSKGSRAGKHGYGSARQKVRMLAWLPEWSKHLSGQLGWYEPRFCESWAKTFKTVASLGYVAPSLLRKQGFTLEQPMVLDAQKGVIAFANRTRGLRIPNPGLSEHSPFMPFIQPMSLLFAFESHDERLGVLNFFIHEVKRPNKDRFMYPIKGLAKFVRIEELREYIRLGESVNREELCNLVDEFAPQIWDAAVEGRSQRISTRVGTISLDASSIYPQSSITWRAKGETSTSIEISSPHKAGMPLLPLKRRIARDWGEKRKDHDLTLFSHDAASDFADGRDEFAEKQVLAPDRSSEERRLLNAQHFGILGMYDPNEDEDVIAAEVVLARPDWHIHSLSKIGPLLSREPIGQDPAGYGSNEFMILYGHFWWTPNVDKAGCGHSHKIGGFWYPYVRLPLRILTGGPKSSWQRAGSDLYPDVTSVGRVTGLVFPQGSDKKARLELNVMNRPEQNGEPVKFGLLFEYVFTDTASDKNAVFQFDYVSHSQGDSVTDPIPSTLTVSLSIDGDAGVLQKRTLVVFPDGFDAWSLSAIDISRPSHASDTYTGDVIVLGVKPVYGLDEMISIGGAPS